MSVCSIPGSAGSTEKFLTCLKMRSFANERIEMHFLTTEDNCIPGFTVLSSDKIISRCIRG